MNLYSDRESQAAAEKSRLAFEQFEKNWEEEIRSARHASHLCVLCGRPLSAIVRIDGSTHHADCEAFVE